MSVETPLAWGAMRACDSPQTGTPLALAQFLGRLADLGVGWIDLADIYADGQAEALTGEALASDPGLANRFKLITKAGVQFPSPSRPHQRVHHYRSDRGFLTAQLDASLKRLKRDQVDLFLVHRPDYLMNAEETAEALRGFIDQGKAAAVGVSNFSTHQVELISQALGAPPASHQLELSVLATGALDDGRLDQAQRDQTTVFAWGALGGAGLFDRADASADRVRSALARLVGTTSDDGLAGAALAWIAHLPVRPIPILGSCRVERIEVQIQGLRATRFGAEDWYEVLQAARGARAP